MTDSSARTVDSRGTLCPQPVIDLARALPSVHVGDEVRLVADDAAAVHDVPAWCRMKGHTLVGVTDDEGVLTFVVRRVH